ncbi:hypothetical protein JKP88DRAFT_347956 [Tribonema minus]|uniref:Coenzyme Q-binding protein COQ10 START domain-containing protein n=1 Tax=Tribonema minus TaxID=303371 RepID=A0A835Z7Q3_9STRA|nr:hypothetical protein JKP88DRAFT_347956 [Tribonema minus]
MRCLLLLALGLAAVAARKELTPHPHQGLSDPYPPGKPETELASKDIQLLRDGKLVQQSFKKGGGAGRALAVQDLHAPPDYVWDRILDFGNYPKMVPKVVKCNNYEVETFRNGTEAIKTRMVMNVFGAKFDNHIYHTYFKSLSSLTWTLDYARRSTLDDSVGYWYVEPCPDKSKQDVQEWSRVYYSCMLRVPKWVPGIVVNFLEKKAVSEANMWLKREAEAKFAKDKVSGQQLGKRGGTGGGVFGGFSLKGAGQHAAAPAAVEEEEDEDEEFTIAGTALGVARKAATFGVGYGAGWFMHARAVRRRSEEE